MTTGPDCSLKIPIEVLPHGRGLPLPAFQTSGSAGLDVPAAIDEPWLIAPGRGLVIPTGFRVAVPQGFEIQVRPRSGLAARHSITVLNSPGTIDSDFRGEIKILLFNFGADSFMIRRGDRIAQLVLARVVTFDWESVESLDKTDRGEGGFGHTGVSE